MVASGNQSTSMVYLLREVPKQNTTHTISTARTTWPPLSIFLFPATDRILQTSPLRRVWYCLGPWISVCAAIAAFGFILRGRRKWDKSGGHLQSASFG